jgi:hypothetical protein
MNDQLEQKPVAWMTDDGFYELEPEGIDVVALYTAPPKREWIGIGHLEIGDLWSQHKSVYSFAFAIESLLKERNG